MILLSIALPFAHTFYPSKGERTSHASMTFRPRWLYASVFSWISLVGGRFLAPFLENVCDLSTSQIGLCLALQAALATLLGSHCGALADRLERQQPGKGRARVILVGIVLGTLCFLSHAIWTHAWQHIVIQMGFAACSSLVFPVLDGLTLDFLEDRSEYGKERLWGAVTWAVASVTAAPLLDLYGFKSLYPCGVVTGLGMVLTLILYMRSSSNVRMTKRDSNVIDADDPVVQETVEEVATSETIPVHVLLGILVGTPYAIAFVIAIVTLASGQAVVDSLIFLFFEELGGSYTVMGWTVVLTVAFEIPIFHVAPRLLEKLGTGYLLLLAGLAYTTRVLGYTLVPDGHMYWVLLLEPLHGVTYACSTTAVVHFCDHLMPKGYEASGQGLVALFRGTGSTIGLWLGGRLEEAWGPRSMYRGSVASVAAGMMTLFLATRWCGPRDEHQDRELVAQDELELSETVSTAMDDLDNNEGLQ